MHKTEAALASIGKFFIGGFRTRRLHSFRKVFAKTTWGETYSYRDRGAYPHSSTRQNARYARQLAAGKLRMEIVTTAPIEAAKPKRRTRKVAADV